MAPPAIVSPARCGPPGCRRHKRRGSIAAATARIVDAAGGRASTSSNSPRPSRWPGGRRRRSPTPSRKPLGPISRIAQRPEGGAGASLRLGGLIELVRREAHLLRGLVQFAFMLDLWAVTRKGFFRAAEDADRGAPQFGIVIQFPVLQRVADSGPFSTRNPTSHVFRNRKPRLFSRALQGSILMSVHRLIDVFLRAEISIRVGHFCFAAASEIRGLQGRIALRQGQNAAEQAGLRRSRLSADRFRIVLFAFQDIPVGAVPLLTSKELQSLPLVQIQSLNGFQARKKTCAALGHCCASRLAEVLGSFVDDVSLIIGGDARGGRFAASYQPLLAQIEPRRQVGKCRGSFSSLFRFLQSLLFAVREFAACPEVSLRDFLGLAEVPVRERRFFDFDRLDLLKVFRILPSGVVCLRDGIGFLFSERLLVALNSSSE